MVVQELREASARVAADARHVRIARDQIALYAASLPAPPPAQQSVHDDPAERELIAWYWLTMDAINFGSGWFPTLRKRPGRTGYSTISSGLADRFDRHGPWSPAELQGLGAGDLAAALHQDPDHELMALFARSLNDLGEHLETDYACDPLNLIDDCNASATHLVDILSAWNCFSDVSRYDGYEVPFLKRAQITAADLARTGAARFDDLDQLTMFADNLVPHVLRLDGILEFAPDLVARIDAEELIEHGSAEEVEIRACALQAVEQIVAAIPQPTTAAEVDQLLWQRGQGPRYKGSPRHRSRCTAY